MRLRAEAEPLANYLHNPLPPGPDVCQVCRSTVEPPWQTCYPCNAHRREGHDVIADAVVPIAYAIDGGQHYMDLKNYKAPRPAPLAVGRLSVISELFFLEHSKCLQLAAGGAIGHVTVVPSTRGKPGLHPLAAMLNVDQNPAHVLVKVDRVYPKEHRRFAADWFAVEPPRSGWRGGVILLDDTWTTGSRIQSAAHTLKQSGASSVVAVVLGRYVRENSPAATSLMDRARSTSFDTTYCVLCQEPAG